MFPDFKSLKQRVGVDDVAYYLGYRLDKAAGIGKYIEMSLSDHNGRSVDSIVISNVGDKGNQCFFHRTTGRGGDVIELIKENINSFGVPQGNNVYETVNAVLCKFANEPIPEKARAEYAHATAERALAFDKKRFEIKNATENMFKIIPIITPRGIDKITVYTFAPHLISIVDLQQKYQFTNLGFPYRKPGSAEIEGAEWRGQYGKKGKVAGTNSSTAAWIADFSSPHGSMPMNAKNVFFFESGFDAMAFYQKNKAQFDLNSSVFVSLGGSFGEKQISGIMSLYKGAKAWDCFDNDLAGRIFAIRMASIVEGKPLTYSMTDDMTAVNVNMNGKNFSMEAENVSIASLRKNIKLNHDIGSWTAPNQFKDWNDCVLNIQMSESKVSKNKLQMIENLREKRSGFKL